MSTNRRQIAGARSMRRVRARRRRRLLGAGGAVLTLALGTTFSVASFSGVDFAAAAVERAKSFMDIMNGRSPGERVAGVLTKTKHRHFRVLAERPIPEIPLQVPASLVDVIAPPEESLIPVAIESPQAVELLSPPKTPPGVIFVPPPGGVPCCSVGPGPPPPPPGSPPPPPPPPPAVPEPGTWLTMVLGFGATGWLLRNRHAVKGKRSPV